MRKVIRQLRHGQITIPKEMREALDLSPDDLLTVDLDRGHLVITPVRLAQKGSAWARELYDLFAPVRESLQDRSEEEICEAIDRAVEEVRARKR